MWCQFCPSDETHQIRLHLADSIKFSFFTNCLQLSCSELLTRTLSREEFEMVLELIFVLWLISAMSSALFSFQIATDGEMGSQWKTMTRRWKGRPFRWCASLWLSQAQSGARCIRFVYLLSFPSWCASAFNHFLKTTKLFKRLLSCCVFFSWAVTLDLVWISHISFDYSQSCTNRSYCNTWWEANVITPSCKDLWNAPQSTHMCIYLVIGIGLCKISANCLATSLYSCVLWK